MKTFSEIVAEHGLVEGSMITKGVSGDYIIKSPVVPSQHVAHRGILAAVAAAEWMNKLHDYVLDTPEWIKASEAQDAYQSHFEEHQ